MSCSIPVRPHIFLFAFASFVMTANTSWAQDEPMDEEAMMKQWQAFATPGEGHERLKYKVGKWKFTNQMWVMPGASPTESEGTAEYKMILGGRYLSDVTNGSFNGMPFEGRGLTGFNNATKKYVTLWIDNMGTGFMPGEGTFDKDKKEWHYTAETTDPMTGKLTKYRSVEKIIDDDHWTMTMYSTGPDGKEFKSMVINYQRDE